MILLSVLLTSLSYAAEVPTAVECRLGRLLTVRNAFSSNSINDRDDAQAFTGTLRLRLVAFQEQGQFWTEVVLEDQLTRKPLFRNSWHGPTPQELGWSTLYLPSHPEGLTLWCRIGHF